jgi:predicted nucleic acid-binding protein
MVCLETSFVIDVLDGNERARSVMDELDTDGSRPTITPVTASELWVGAYFGSAGELETTRELLDSLTWLSFSRSCARRAGKLQAALKREGSPLGIADCMIAAIAIEHGEPLVTRDEDFTKIDELAVRTY